MSVDSSSEAGEEDVVALTARPSGTGATRRRPAAVTHALGMLEATAARDEELRLRAADVDETEGFPSSAAALRVLRQLPAHGQRKKEQHQPHRLGIFSLRPEQKCSINAILDEERSDAGLMIM